MTRDAPTSLLPKVCILSSNYQCFEEVVSLVGRKIEELLRQFGVTDDEIDELKCQDAINIRKLRVVATSGMCYSENVRAALISVGELGIKIN